MGEKISFLGGDFISSEIKEVVFNEFKVSSLSFSIEVWENDGKNVVSDYLYTIKGDEACLSKRDYFTEQKFWTGGEIVVLKEGNKLIWPIPHYCGAIGFEFSDEPCYGCIYFRGYRSNIENSRNKDNAFIQRYGVHTWGFDKLEILDLIDKKIPEYCSNLEKKLKEVKENE